VAILISPLAFADDADDVMAVVQQWADTEADLVAQARLIRDDRVQVTGNGRQSDQAGNLRVQLANHNARVKMAGGEPEMIVRIESPQVAVYGDTAVVSFLRLFNVIPHNSDPLPQNRAWFTLVLVKERGSWGIAHSHVSQAN
jgi:ketosteroid isomerase-like protein